MSCAASPKARIQGGQRGRWKRGRREWEACPQLCSLRDGGLPHSGSSCLRVVCLIDDEAGL
eukprot:925548-Prorocentrum_lima.AAC.1